MSDVYVYVSMYVRSLDPRPFWPREEGSGEYPRPEVSSRWNAAVSVVRENGCVKCEYQYNQTHATKMTTLSLYIRRGRSTLRSTTI